MQTPTTGNALENIAAMLWITVAVYNLAVIVLLRTAMEKIDWNKIMLEKRYLPYASAPVPPNQPPPPPPSNDPPYSYSRAVGTIGGLIIAGFFWAIGNLVLFYGFESPGALVSIVPNIWPLFVAGSALFLPYAFNQLATFFTPRA